LGAFGLAEREGCRVRAVQAVPLRDLPGDLLTAFARHRPTPEESIVYGIDDVHQSNLDSGAHHRLNVVYRETSGVGRRLMVLCTW
jgi:hypothetical protein